MSNSYQAPEFWTRVSSAADQGRLSRLGQLPQQPEEDFLESYLSTVLHLKGSLTSLVIDDFFATFGTDLCDLGVYQELCEQFKEFKVSLASFSIQKICK